MLSVLMIDVRKDVLEKFGDPPAGTQCADVAPANHASSSVRPGAPRWGKTVHMQIRHTSDAFTPQGAPVKIVSSAVYLGGLLREDEDTGASVARRVGEARGAFESWKTVWKHASITRQWNLYLFSARVVTQLTHSLEALCLRQTDRDKINAFQAHRLRKRSGVPHSMISRVSNEAVRNMSRQRKISLRVLYNQLIMADEGEAARDYSGPESCKRNRKRLSRSTDNQLSALHDEAWRKAVYKYAYH
eukprot:4368503-Pyramimonas_sp.AAC.1